MDDDLWNVHGISMEYLWNTYKMGYDLNVLFGDFQLVMGVPQNG